MPQLPAAAGGPGAAPLLHRNRGEGFGPRERFCPPGVSAGPPRGAPGTTDVLAPAAAARRGDPLEADAFGGGQGAATPGWGAPRDPGACAGGAVKPPAASGQAPPQAPLTWLGFEAAHRVAVPGPAPVPVVLLVELKHVDSDHVLGEAAQRGGRRRRGAPAGGSAGGTGGGPAGGASPGGGGKAQGPEQEAAAGQAAGHRGLLLRAGGDRAAVSRGGGGGPPLLKPLPGQSPGLGAAGGPGSPREGPPRSWRAARPRSFKRSGARPPAISGRALIGDARPAGGTASGGEIAPRGGERAAVGGKEEGRRGEGRKGPAGTAIASRGPGKKANPRQEPARSSRSSAGHCSLRAGAHAVGRRGCAWANFPRWAVSTGDVKEESTRAKFCRAATA